MTETTTHQAKSYAIVGAHFRPPAKAILEGLAIGTPLTLRPEPDNPFDANAIQVMLRTADVGSAAQANIAKLLPMYGSDIETFTGQDEWHLGYIPRQLAAMLAPTLQGDTQGKLTFSASGTPMVTTQVIMEASHG